MRNYDTRRFTAFRYSIYASAIIGYFLYLVYLICQLATDHPLLDTRYDLNDTAKVPIIEMCGFGDFEILRCDSKLNNGTTIPDECTKFVSAVNVTYESDGQQKYCRLFNATGSVEFIEETKNATGLNKLKFYYKTNRTEAQEGKLGVALLNINLFFTSIGSNQEAKMDKAIQERRKLQGNFVPAPVDSVSLIKFRTGIYESVSSWAIFGFDPKYRETLIVECQANFFPFNKEPPSAIDNIPRAPLLTDGYFSVSPGDFIIERITEKRSTTVLSTIASAGGALGVVGSILWFLFGSTRLDTHGIARKIAKDKRYLTKMLRRSRNNPRERKTRININDIDLEEYLNFSYLEHLNEMKDLD